MPKISTSGVDHISHVVDEAKVGNDSGKFVESKEAGGPKFALEKGSKKV